MLGVTTYDEDTPADLLLKEYAEANGFGDTYAKTRVGVFLGEAGRTVPDPYLRRRGAGADRLRALRAVHDRLPSRREEHADQELPVVRRDAAAPGSSRSEP